MIRHDDDEAAAESRIRDLRQRLGAISGIFHERNVNVNVNENRNEGDTKGLRHIFVDMDRLTESANTFEDPESTLHERHHPSEEAAEQAATACKEGEAFDAFRVIQQRLREKMRKLHASAGARGGVPVPVADHTSWLQGTKGPTTPVPLELPQARGTECSPLSSGASSPGRDASVTTALPPAGGQCPSPVVADLFSDSEDDEKKKLVQEDDDAVHHSEQQGYRPHECIAIRSPAVEKHVAAHRSRMGQRSTVSPPPSPPQPSNPSHQHAGLDSQPAHPAPARCSTRSSTARSSSSRRPHRQRWRSSSHRRNVSQRPEWDPRSSSKASSADRPEMAASPRPLWSEAKVLATVTGAELFAIFRMRGLVVSVGDTEEDRLPQTRCHAVYLTPREHEQLLSLREILELRAYAENQHRARSK